MTGRSIAYRVASIALAASLAACGDHLTAPTTVTSCGSTATLQLATLHGAVAECGAGPTTLTLAANGATYVIIPQFATGNVASTPVGYMIQTAGGVAASAQIAADSRAAASAASAASNAAQLVLARATAQRNPRQIAFDAIVHSRTHRAMARGEWRGRSTIGANVHPPLPQAAIVPELGSERPFSVVATIDSSSQHFATVTARLAYIGQNILIYIDVNSPPNGFTPAQLTSFGDLFDQTLYPLDVSTFGAPSDVDANGHLVMLLSPVVNALTPANLCISNGFVAGFFFGHDLVSSTPTSNHGEIFYSLVPDPQGTVSCPHTISQIERFIPSTFLHELQHLISFSQHVVLHAGQEEEGWLDEGLSRVAEELGSIHYEERFPPPSGRSDPRQIFPDSAQGFITELLIDSYGYLLQPDTTTLTLHSDADDGLAWRGGDWLLLRWLGDQKGNAIFKALEQSSLTGTANIAAAAGEPFAPLFGDFGAALYVDSIPGIARSAIPPRERFLSRNLRLLYQAVFNAFNPSSIFPRPFPILASPLSPGRIVSATMRPGTMSFYLLTTRADAATAQIKFTDANGNALSATLHPQLSVFRLP